VARQLDSANAKNGTVSPFLGPLLHRFPPVFPPFSGMVIFTFVSVKQRSWSATANFLRLNGGDLHSSKSSWRYIVVLALSPKAPIIQPP
jgi:hypothetical protein